MILSSITFATESSAGCLSTVQSGDLGKTEVEVGGIVGRPNSIGGRTLPHGGGAPRTLTPSKYLKLVLCCLFVCFFGHLDTFSSRKDDSAGEICN